MSSNPFSQEQKRFSVIAPVHKQSWNTFDKFFQALNEQDYKAFEVIVVFDGENPEGEKELKKYEKQYPLLDIVSYTKPWGGAPAARNYGAKHATGDYLTFLDPDVYLYSETLRFWANAFEEHPEKDVVWGLYDVIIGETRQTIGGQVCRDGAGNVDYYSFRSSNYCSGANPVRKEAFIGWDETVKSLQDWDMWMRMLLKDDFKGEKFLYFHRSFFVTEPPQAGGISDDSHKNWIERVRYVREKNGVPIPDVVVCSGGAPYHAVHVAKKLGADWLPDPTFKPNTYKTLYLLGYYTASREAFGWHANVLMNFSGKKIVHWIGTDVYNLDNNISVKTLRELKAFWKRQHVTHLAEVDYIQKELKQFGIIAQVVPIPPPKLYDPMPLPENFSVAIYENDTQKMYSEALMMEIVRSMPDVQFYFFGAENENKGKEMDNVSWLGWINFDEWMPKFSMNLRITVHDGLPLTPLQFLTAGRPVITNVPLKDSIVMEGKRKEIVEEIRKIRREKTTVDASYWKDELKTERFIDHMKKYL